MSALKPSCMDTQTGLVPHGAMEEHLPLRHFQFWSSCMYLKSLQMPLQVQSGLPDIFNQSQVISIIRICRIMLKSFPSLNCSALHFRQNMMTKMSMRLLTLMSPSLQKVLSLILKSQSLQVGWERLQPALNRRDNRL